jgi:hypothetical protein
MQLRNKDSRLGMQLRSKDFRVGTVQLKKDTRIGMKARKWTLEYRTMKLMNNDSIA